MTAQPAELDQLEQSKETSNVIDISDKVGLVLATARKQRELTIASVSKELHIRTEYLTAFEEDDYSAMPGTSYTKGFLKAYADFLDLDAAAIIRAVKAKGYLQEDIKHHIPQPIENNIVPSRTIILSTFAVLILLLAAWGMYALQPTEKPIPLAEETAEVSPTVQQPVEATLPEPMVTVEPKTEATQVETTVESAEVATLPEPQPEEIITPVTATNTVELIFSDEVWLQIRSPEGRVYVNNVFKAGETYTLPDRPGALLDIGKPSAVRVWINGEDHTPWESDIRRVLKDIPTDANLIKEWRNN